jgi:D-sedoheptulose 7-phosphate isomerase
MNELIVDALDQGITARNELRTDVDKILKAAEILVSAFRDGKKVLAAGNGGSAADAQHFVAEFEGTYSLERRGLPALCLNANGSTITAWSNDFSFETVFARQIEAHGKPGDVFVALSTSGGSLTEAHSRNIAVAAKKAKAMGLSVIGLAGREGGALKELADVCIIVKSKNTARIQECHITVLHILTELVEQVLFVEGPTSA